MSTRSTNIYDLADELLELVLLRVSSHRCLVRAAAACRPWRRVIAADCFLHRFRSVHAPLVLGHFYAGARTAFVAAPSPPGNAVAGGGVRLGFLLDNFGDMGDLFLSDCRGGLLAFICMDSSVAVCDPWARRYRVLVPPPTPGKRPFCLGVFLVDASETSPARVLCVCCGFVSDEQNGTISTAQVSVFLATDEHWILLASTIVVESQFVMAALILGLWRQNTSDFCVGRVGGSLYWSVQTSYVFQVNETTGALSSFCLPPAKFDSDNLGCKRRKLRVVGGDARAARIVRIVDDELQVFQFVYGGEMCAEQKGASLSELCNMEEEEEEMPDRSWHFLELSEAVAPSCVVLSPDEKCKWMFYLDVESMEVNRVERRHWHDRPLFPYEQPWTPTIKACA